MSLNWIKGERSEKRGHTYRTDEEYSRFIIHPIGSSGRFSLVEVTHSGSGRSEIVIVRGISVAACKSVAQQIVDDETLDAQPDRGFSYQEMVEGMGLPIDGRAETMPSAERRTKVEQHIEGKRELQDRFSRLTNESQSLESTTQRNVEPISNEGSEAVATATEVSQEPLILKEEDARRLARAMGKPEDTWTVKRMQKKFNELEELLADAAEIEEKEDRILLKTVSRHVQEWDGGDGPAVIIESSNGSNGEASESPGDDLEVGDQEPSAKKTKATKEPKPVPLPNPSRKILYAQPDPPPHTFNQQEIKDFLGWREVRKQDAHHFKYQIGDTVKYVALDNCLTNRKFRFPLAKRYAAEHIRGKWSFNGETIVLDKYGNVQQGMHRGAGFVLAEEQRAFNPEKYGKKPLTYTTALQTGIEPANDVVDTIDLGQKRSLGDVLFRNREMGKDYTERDQSKLTRVLAGAIRLVWLRVEGRSVMGGQAFLHSEALELLKTHPDIVDCVKFVYDEDGGRGADGKRISSSISLAYAAGLMYLMAKAKGGKTKAQEFWTLFASGAFNEGDPILALKKILERKNAGSGRERESIIGTVIKAWTLWTEGKKKVKPSDIAVKKGETPRFGGIDKDKEAKLE